MSESRGTHDSSSARVPGPEIQRLGASALSSASASAT